MFTIVLTAAADRQYKKLPKEVARAIAGAFDGEFSRNPLSQALDVKKLHVPFEGYRLRVRTYRILFTVEEGVITVYSIKHRRDAYK